jgi:hypothetical protein
MIKFKNEILENPDIQDNTKLKIKKMDENNILF